MGVGANLNIKCVLYIGGCRAVWRGTRAILGYAAFDVQLRKVYFVTTHVRYTYVYAHICYMLVNTCLRIQSLRYEYT